MSKCKPAYGHTPIVDRRNSTDAQQKIYRFENGYGASLIEGGSMAYGGREIAVIKFDGPGVKDWDLNYDTPVTDDVLGYLAEADVQPILDQIKALPAPEGV